MMLVSFKRSFQKVPLSTKKYFSELHGFRTRQQDDYFSIPCVSGIVTIINKEIEPKIFLFFSFALSKPLFGKFAKNLRPQPICRCAFVFPGTQSCFPECILHFAGPQFSLHKGHDPWHTLQILSTFFYRAFNFMRQLGQQKKSGLKSNHYMQIQLI